MSEYPHHESLRLQNFTAFADASFEFVPGINVFIGENGMGKTHAMKAMYAWQRLQERSYAGSSTLQSAFQLDRILDLVRSKEGDFPKAHVSGDFSGRLWEMTPQHEPSDEGGGLTYRGTFHRMPSCVFIPALDMMGHTRGFLSTYDLYKIDFDLTHREIVSLLLAPELRELTEVQQGLASALESALGGKLELEGERFYLRTNKNRLAMPSVAEGLRKIATLLRLIQGGWLRPGSTLFWDEPEVNLNPVLMDEVVSALLGLARNGVQIFLATHSYVILKELDLQSKEGEVRYFAFKPGEEGTTVSHNEDFGLLDPNPILDQYDSLFSRDIEKTVNGRGR